mmetsp:Transcript_18377/g.30117  ORF Transcript_18377/g.30117 Transcript_18377/m.30117 type:complete len:249 (+) Transcript_18377:497-1243(+)
MELMHVNAIPTLTLATAINILRSCKMQLTIQLIQPRAGKRPLAKTLFHREIRRLVLKMSSLQLTLDLCLLRMATCLLAVGFAKQERPLQMLVARSTLKTISSHRLRSRDANNAQLLTALAHRAILKSASHAKLVPVVKLWTERASACVTMVPLIHGILLVVNVKHAPHQESILVLPPTQMATADVRSHVLPPFHLTLPNKIAVVLPTSYAVRNLDVRALEGPSIALMVQPPALSAVPLLLDYEGQQEH